MNGKFSSLKFVFERFDEYNGNYPEPRLVGPQGGCYPARITSECMAFGGFQKVEGRQSSNRTVFMTLLQPSSIIFDGICKKLTVFSSLEPSELLQYANRLAPSDPCTTFSIMGNNKNSSC